MEQNVAVATRLRSLCEEKGITVAMLAEKTGMSVRRIYRMMHIGASNPGIYTMHCICKALEITIDEFLDSDEFKNMNEYRY